MGEIASVLDVDDLKVSFGGAPIIQGVGLRVDAGQTLCLLGESGSGKSVLLRALMRLLDAKSVQTSGRIQIAGKDVQAMTQRQLEDARGTDVAMVFQEPSTALDPVYTMGRQITEMLRRHRALSRAQARARAIEILELVRMPDAARRLDSYPHELSGGLRQRAMIAVALSCRPKLLLADEPTTALDATVQIQILLLLRGLQQELGMAMVLVTHDLGVAAQVADRIAVIYAGRIVEQGSAADVLKWPSHPYTAAMLASAGRVRNADRLPSADGGAPAPDMTTVGCSFAPRCRYATDLCQRAVPTIEAISEGRGVACFHPIGTAIT